MSPPFQMRIYLHQVQKNSTSEGSANSKNVRCTSCFKCEFICIRCRKIQSQRRGEQTREEYETKGATHIHNKQPLATVPSSLIRIRSGTDWKLGCQRRATVLSLSLPAWLGVGVDGLEAGLQRRAMVNVRGSNQERERERERGGWINHLTKRAAESAKTTARDEVKGMSMSMRRRRDATATHQHQHHLMSNELIDNKE